MRPQVKSAKSGDLKIAYQVTGSGPSLPAKTHRLLLLAAALAGLMAACQPAVPSAGTQATPPSAATTATPRSAGPTPSPEPQRNEPPLPEQREETAAAASDDRLYVIGGYDAVGISRPETFVFDGHSWSRGPDLPIGLDHPAATTLDGQIYLAGGFNSGRASARFFRLEGDSWRELPALHHARGALALVAVAGRLYALAGNSGKNQVAESEWYEPGGKAWQEQAPLLKPRNHVAGFALAQLACIAGGRSPNTADIDCLDTPNRTWTRLPGLPNPTSGAGAGTLPGDIVVVGGGEDAQEARMVNQLARWSPGHPWTVEPMLHPRHGVAFALFKGRLWACGGGDLAGLHPVATCTSIG